jgi:hypothetical protein
MASYPLTAWISWPSPSGPSSSSEEDEFDDGTACAAGGCDGDEVSQTAAGHGIECTDEKPLQERNASDSSKTNPTTDPSLPESHQAQTEALRTGGMRLSVDPSFDSSRARFSPAIGGRQDLRTAGDMTNKRR